MLEYIDPKLQYVTILTRATLPSTNSPNTLGLREQFVTIYMNRYSLTSNPVAIFVVISIDTNNPQGMQLGRFKNRTPARFEYIYCTLFPLCHSNQDMYPFLKDAPFCPCFCFCAYDSSVLQNFKIFTHLLSKFSYKDPR